MYMNTYNENVSVNISYLIDSLLKKPRTSIPTFSSSAGTTSADLSVATEPTIDASTKQKESIDVEIDEVLKAATAGLGHYLVGLLQKQSKQNAFAISKYVLAMIAEINPSTSYIENQIKTLLSFRFYQAKAILKNVTRRYLGIP
jgi:hypothetical protein